MANPIGEFIEEKAMAELLQKGVSNVLDLIAPAALKITPNFVQMGDLYLKTLFVYTYPEYVQTNWLSPIVNYDIAADISMFIYPMESAVMMKQLRKKAAQLESSAAIEKEKGLVRNPELESAIENVETLRDTLQKGSSRLFQYGLYFTIYAKSLEEMDVVVKQIESTLGGLLIYTKQALLQMEQGFISSLPLCIDQLQILRNLDTASLSASFPFISSELSTGEGILYGINRHNNSLILFDRFSLENANSVVFAKAGAGKSYGVKLEILRSLMFDTNVIVLDPENEYLPLVEAVGGVNFHLSLKSDQRINPFDLPQKLEEGETGEEVLRSTIISVKGLLRLLLGNITPEEDSLLDKALFETYAIKDITSDPASFKNQPPLLSDFENILQNISGAESLVIRLKKYTEGTFAGLLNKPTNCKIDNKFTVFSIRDLEEELRPIGMYLILNYIWNEVRKELRKRILVIDEAWWLMQYEDSARFLYGFAKRARKYYLGLTIITQDVEDFLASSKGRAVINNSSLQILLKQSTAAIDKIAEVFHLTEGEKFLLLEADIGEGLFFAGQNHVAIKIIASPDEDQLISTSPKEILERETATAQQTASAPIAPAEENPAEEGPAPPQAQTIQAQEPEPNITEEQPVSEEPAQTQTPTEPQPAQSPEPNVIEQPAEDEPVRTPPQPQQQQEAPQPPMPQEEMQPVESPQPTPTPAQPQTDKPQQEASADDNTFQPIPINNQEEQTEEMPVKQVEV